MSVRTATGTVPVMTDRDSFMVASEIAAVGFASVGAKVRISRLARFYRPSAIRLGDEVRIDDFAVLSAGLKGIALEGFNHVAVGALIFGDVTLRPWSTLSSRAAIYSISDDFTVDTHTYPNVEAGRFITSEPVMIGSRVVVGTGSTILPGVTIVDGVSIGAMSLVTRPIERPGLYVGMPVRFLRERRATVRGDAARS